MDARSFLRSIRSTSTVDEVLTNLNDIKVLADSPQISTTKVQSKLDESIDSVLSLKKNLRRLDMVLALYQKQADTNLPLIKQLLDSVINNYTSAYNATIEYDKVWFANTMFSEDAKIELAEYLLKSINVYCKDNCETLQMIINLNPEMLTFISWPRLNSD